MVKGRMIPDNYGKLTSVALDPIEKKPLARFRPGTKIFSVGSYGCNLACPFCQNDSISYAGPGDVRTVYVSPEALVKTALREIPSGNTGIAFTYNEPLIGWEYVRDTAALSREAGLVNVLVTNGTATEEIFDELCPYIDAMNVDLKGFSEDYYGKFLGGDFSMVKSWIKRAAEETYRGNMHLELTTLIIPGENDSEEEMRELACRVAGLPGGEDIPLHVTRFFPRHDLTDRGPTPVRTVYRLADTAREYLNYVYTGNC